MFLHEKNVKLRKYGDSKTPVPMCIRNVPLQRENLDSIYTGTTVSPPKKVTFCQVGHKAQGGGGSTIITTEPYGMLAEDDCHLDRTAAQVVHSHEVGSELVSKHSCMLPLPATEVLLS